MKRLFFILLALICFGGCFVAHAGQWPPPYMVVHPFEPELITYNQLTSPTGTDYQNNEYIKAVKYGSGVQILGFTGNLSTVAGTAFITNPSTDLRLYVGYKITLTAGGKTLVGWIKAAGDPAGQTYTAALNVSNCANDPTALFDTFENVSATGFHAVGDGSAAQRCGTADEIAFTSGNLFIVTLTYSKASGSNPDIRARASLDGTAISNTRDLPLSSNYFGVTTTTTGVFSFYELSATDFTISNLACRKVLTPSATGVTIVDGQGSSTFSWTSNDGIDPNSTYTATITAQ